MELDIITRNLDFQTIDEIKGHELDHIPENEKLCHWSFLGYFTSTVESIR